MPRRPSRRRVTATPPPAVDDTGTPVPDGRAATDTSSRRQVVGSAVWATAQQTILLGSSAVVAVLLAHVMSLTDYGIYSYATSLISVGLALTSAGLSGLAIKALLDERYESTRTMSSLVLIREAFALLSFLILFGIAVGTASSGKERLAVGLALLVLFARAFDAVEFWYQSRLKSKRSATVRVVVTLVMLLIRLGLVLTGESALLLFTVLLIVESLVVTGSLVVRYLREPGSPRFGRPDLAESRRLLSSSWLLMLSGAASQVNLKADQVILQALKGSAAVGIYASAARLSELTYFLPSVFMTATFPVLIKARKDHGSESRAYRTMLQGSYDRSCWAGIGIMAVIWFLGPTIIHLLYGAKFHAAGPVLRIHVLALPFVFMSYVFSKWIVNEHLLWASLNRHGLGAALNVALNLWLVPHWGLRGAAIATVASYTTSSYLACFVGRSTRQAGIQMTLALVWPVRLLLGFAGRSPRA